MATYPSGLRGWFAKPIFTGSNPVVAFEKRKGYLRISSCRFYLGFKRSYSVVSWEDVPSIQGDIMICSKCGRNANSKASRCMYCGGALILETRTEPIQCSACSQTMIEIEEDGVDIDVCPSCGGVWCDVGELETLIDVKQPIESRQNEGVLRQSNVYTSPSNDQNSVRFCPICSRPMARENFSRSSGVIVDRCRFHGFFLDKDELNQIVDFAAQGGLNYQEQKDRLQQRADASKQKLSKSRSKLHDARVGLFRWHGDAHEFRTTIFAIQELLGLR